MSNIDKQALRNAAKIATPGPWYVHDKPCEDGNYGIDTSDKEFLAEAVVWWGFARQSIWREEDAKFIAAANPATVLALLDELEAKDRRIAELTEALKQTVSGYKSCLRTGHERILELGGDCDAPEVMIAGNPDIQLAEKLIASGTAKGE